MYNTAGMEKKKLTERGVEIPTTIHSHRCRNFAKRLRRRKKTVWGGGQRVEQKTRGRIQLENCGRKDGWAGKEMSDPS